MRRSRPHCFHPPCMPAVCLAAYFVWSSLGCSWTLDFDGLDGEAGASPDAGTGGDAGADPGALPVDCQDPALVLDPVCVPVDHAQRDCVGSGPVLAAGVGDPVDLGFGFVDGRRLVIAADGDGTDGALLGVDLETGERAVLSGEIRDIEATTHARGAGPSLAGVTDVALMPDGSWLAATFTLPRKLIRVDPDTGDRNLLWSWSEMVCERPDGGDPVQIHPQDWYGNLIEVEQDGAVLFPAVTLDTNGDAIVRWKEEGCTVVSFNERDTSDVIGGGPMLLGGIRAMERRGGRLYALGASTYGLIEIDLDSGDRRLASRWEDPRIGTGKARIGNDALAPGQDVIWSLGPANRSSFILTEIDVETGDRLGHEDAWGPVYQVTADVPRIWLHGSERWLVLELAGGFVLYDPKTDNSNLLSY